MKMELVLLKNKKGKPELGLPFLRVGHITEPQCF
jgi:hypothetical protein